MTARVRVGKIAGVALASLALAGCVRGCTSNRPPIHLNPSMDDQPKLLPQSESTFFYDGSAMRPPVPGTVARGELRESSETFEGKGPDGKFVTAIPVPVDEHLLDRGQQRYGIYCQPCHDARGDGHGILFQRGKIPTASLHDKKVLDYPDGQLFDIITNGSGLMPAYRWPIPPADRWAIIAYVRTMERKRAASSEPDVAAAQ
jgi:mono/diheme cytochrome c family protein